MIKTLYTHSRGRIKTLRQALAAVLFLVVLPSLLAGCGAASDSSSKASSSPVGRAGSQARFAIVGDYLYTVNRWDLQIFDITTPATPSAWRRQSIGFDIETIFSYNNYLFIGSQEGVYIYDNSEPQFPRRVSSLVHARSCDPVVVEGNYAYVTLRSRNSRCSRGSNQLDVIDITDIYKPFVVRTFAMQQPAGLGVDSGKVFVCDGLAGLKVFDAADPVNLTLLDRVTSQDCYDLIPASGLLVVSGADGLYQYDYSALPITELSKMQNF